eukprot:jgi/Mesen1/3534/ME000197S02548
MEKSRICINSVQLVGHRSSSCESTLLSQSRAIKVSPFNPFSYKPGVMEGAGGATQDFGFPKGSLGSLQDGSSWMAEAPYTPPSRSRSSSSSATISSGNGGSGSSFFRVLPQSRAGSGMMLTGEESVEDFEGFQPPLSSSPSNPPHLPHHHHHHYPHAHSVDQRQHQQQQHQPHHSTYPHAHAHVHSHGHSQSPPSSSQLLLQQQQRAAEQRAAEMGRLPGGGGGGGGEGGGRAAEIGQLRHHLESSEVVRQEQDCEITHLRSELLFLKGSHQEKLAELEDYTIKALQIELKAEARRGMAGPDSSLLDAPEEYAGCRQFFQSGYCHFGRGRRPCPNENSHFCLQCGRAHGTAPHLILLRRISDRSLNGSSDGSS